MGKRALIMPMTSLGRSVSLNDRQWTISAILSFKLFHERNQRFDAADATDTTVILFAAGVSLGALGHGRDQCPKHSVH
jgi:hypothetical protein